MRKKSKPIVPSICPQNVDGASPSAAVPTSSNLYRKPSIVLSLTLFRSDLPPLDQKKTDKEPVDEFFKQDDCRRMKIKDFLPKQTNFCKYTWKVVACMVITGERRLDPNI